MTNPFDLGRDEALGRILRERFEASGHAVFVARLREAVARADIETSWDVLARWARPGVAAAAAIALMFSLWLSFAPPTDTGVATLAEAVQAVGVPAPLLAGGGDVSADAVFAAIVGER